ncbi:MAG: type I secretion outer membrane protein [bacterium]|nr:MAG: type I secretion outer membrane protein [bacterium]
MGVLLGGQLSSRIFSLVLLVFFLFVPFRVGADEIIKKGEVLNLERCVEIALKKQPNIIAAMNIVSINQSRVGQAKANYYPQIDLSSGYSKSSPFSSASSRSSDEYSSGVSLKQNIYDFGKTTTRVEIQRLNLDSSRLDLENVSDQIVFNVKQAYYRVLQAKRNRDVAEEAVRQFKKHLEQAKGFYEVGTKPKFDVTKAEVDLSNAKLNLIKAENAIKVSRVILSNTMGMPDATEYSLVDNLTFVRYDITLEDMLKTAYNKRPDLTSILIKKKAAEASIEMSKKDYYPTLSGNATYGRVGERFPLEDSWNVGMTISFPVFSGLSTRYQVEEAMENLNVLKANEEALKQGVVLEVQQAYLNLKDVEERIPTAELIVKQAEENLEMANGRYAAGVGNPIEVTDAEVSLSNAKTAYIQSLYDYKATRASLEKAMGIR